MTSPITVALLGCGSVGSQVVRLLTEQRDDLAAELTALVDDLAAGRRTLKVYRQFKMYNDPAYRAAGAPNV